MLQDTLSQRGNIMILRHLGAVQAHPKPITYLERAHAKRFVLLLEIQEFMKTLAA